MSTIFDWLRKLLAGGASSARGSGIPPASNLVPQSLCVDDLHVVVAKPGDLVLLTYPFFMKPEQRTEVAAHMKTLEERFSGVRFCVFDGVSGISIVRKASE